MIFKIINNKTIYKINLIFKSYNHNIILMVKCKLYRFQIKKMLYKHNKVIFIIINLIVYSLKKKLRLKRLLLTNKNKDYKKIMELLKYDIIYKLLYIYRFLYFYI